MGTKKQRWCKDKQIPQSFYIRYYYFTNDFVIIFLGVKKRRWKTCLNYLKEPEIVISDIHSKYRTSGSKMGQKEISKTLKILLRSKYSFMHGV